MSSIDDVEFIRVPNADIPGASLRVLGSHLYSYFGSDWNACFLMCAAADDCAAFVVHKPLSTCAFKRKSGKVLRNDQYESDAFILKSVPPSPTRSSQPSPPPLPLSELSEHRIFLVPDFVSRHEASTLRKYATACLRRRDEYKLVPPVGDVGRVSLGTAECLAAEHAVLLARIEERMARLTGMPAHEGEETLLFTNVTPVGRDGPWFSNLHHDKNKQERREATILVYLSSQSDEEGGHTIFPSLPRQGANAASGAPWAASMERAYGRGRRALGCQAESDDCGDEGGVVPHARAECERALTGTAHGVAVRPTLGTALVFFSVHPNGSADASMWHTGCLPRTTTNGRWAMQKFKSATAADFASCSAINT